jgi:hypothetical protein
VLIATTSIVTATVVLSKMLAAPVITSMIVETIVVVKMVAVIKPAVLKAMVIKSPGIYAIVIVISVAISAAIYTFVPPAVKSHTVIMIPVIFGVQVWAWCTNLVPAGISPVKIAVRARQICCSYPAAAIVIIVTFIVYAIVGIHIWQIIIILIAVIIYRFAVNNRLPVCNYNPVLNIHGPQGEINTYT